MPPSLVVPAPAFDPGATLKAIEQERCTGAMCVPTMFIAGSGAIAATDDVPGQPPRQVPFLPEGMRDPDEMADLTWNIFGTDYDAIETLGKLSRVVVGFELLFPDRVLEGKAVRLIQIAGGVRRVGGGRSGPRPAHRAP